MSKFIRKAISFFLWFFAGLMILMIIFSCVLFFGSQIYLNKNLSEYVADKTDGLYHLNFDNIELHFWDLGFNIRGLELKPDRLKAEEIQKNNPERLFYSFSTPELQIHKLDPIELFTRERLTLNKVSIVKPGFSITGARDFDRDSARTFDSALNEFRQVFHKYLKEVVINEIDLIDAKYQFYNMVGDSSGVSKADKISIVATKFRIDSVSLEKSTYPFEAEDILIQMKNFRSEMGDSIHFVEIDSLEYSFTNSELSAFHLNLFSRHEAPDKNIYHLRMPKFKLRSKSIVDIYSSDSLYIEYLEFDDPEIFFSRKEEPKHIKIEDIDKFNLYELVRNSFSFIKVDSFYLNNASLEVSRQNIDTSYQQRFRQVDVHLMNFLLDSLSGKDPDKIFYADDIEMAIGGYELRLDDNIHNFTADTIFVSTFTGEIDVSKVRIYPNITNVKPPVEININCDRLSLQGVNMKEIYHTGVMPLTKIEISHPRVLLDYYADSRKRKGKGQAGILFDLVSAYLNGVYSKVVFIDGGVLKIQSLKRNRQIGFFESDFTFSLTDFSLDSASVKKTDQLFYATNFDLDFSNYRMKLVDNLHKIQVKHIKASSHESKVTIDSLHLSPVLSHVTQEEMIKFKRSELFNISVPKITLQNSNLHEAIFSNKLSISDFNISNPSIYFENFAALKQGKAKREFAEFYQLIFNYLDEIAIGKVTVPEGEILWVNHSKTGKTTTLDNKFSVELTNFKLNEKELGKKKLFFSENINFSLKDQLYKLSDNVHYLQAKQIDFSTTKSSIVFKDALFYPDITSPEYLKKPTTFQITIPRLAFEGVNIVPAYFSGNIEVHGITAISPRFELYSQEGKAKPLDFKDIVIPLPPRVKSLKIGRVKVTDGEVITYRTKDRHMTQSGEFKLGLDAEDISLSGGESGKQAILQTGDIMAKLSDLQLILKGKAHKITVDKFLFDKRKGDATIINFNVSPSKYGRPGNAFTISVPRITLKGLDTKRAYLENVYDFDKIEVSSPIIDIELSDIKQKKGLSKLKGFDLYPYLEPYLNELNIGELSLDNAKVSFKGIGQGLKYDNINVLLKKISVNRGNSGQQLLNSDEIELTAFNLNQISADNRYNLNVATFNYTSSGNTVKLSGLSIRPRYSNEELARLAGYQVDVLNAQIDYLLLSSFDVGKWLDHKTVHAKHLEIGPSQVDIFRDKRYVFNPNQKVPWPQDLLSAVKMPFIIDSVTLMPSSIKYSELLDATEDPVSITFTDLKARLGRVSNIYEIVNANPVLVANASARINRGGQLKATVTFNLNDADYTHTIKGSLQPLDMRIFNSLIEKAAFVTVEKGNLNRFDFEMTLDDKKAKGQLFFGYDNLKVALIEYNQGEVKKAGLASLMLNSLVINSKNPRGKILNPEVIDYRRDPRRSVINYWWKAVFDGAKKALGIKKKDKRE